MKRIGEFSVGFADLGGFLHLGRFEAQDCFGFVKTLFGEVFEDDLLEVVGVPILGAGGAAAGGGGGRGCIACCCGLDSLDAAGYCRGRHCRQEEGGTCQYKTQVSEEEMFKPYPTGFSRIWRLYEDLGFGDSSKNDQRRTQH